MTPEQQAERDAIFTDIFRGLATLTDDAALLAQAEGSATKKKKPGTVDAKTRRQAIDAEERARKGFLSKSGELLKWKSYADRWDDPEQASFVQQQLKEKRYREWAQDMIASIPKGVDRSIEGKARAEALSRGEPIPESKRAKAKALEAAGEKGKGKGKGKDPRSEKGKGYEPHFKGKGKEKKGADRSAPYPIPPVAHAAARWAGAASMFKGAKGQPFETVDVVMHG